MKVVKIWIKTKKGQFTTVPFKPTSVDDVQFPKNCVLIQYEDMQYGSPYFSLVNQENWFSHEKDTAMAYALLTRQS